MPDSSKQIFLKTWQNVPPSTVMIPEQFKNPNVRFVELMCFQSTLQERRRGQYWQAYTD